MLTFLWLGAPKNEGTTDSRITAICGYIDILDRKVVKTRFKEFSVGLGCLQPVELLSEGKNFQGLSLRLRKKTRIATTKDRMISSTNSHL
jgi:hypothetical protein